MAQIDDGIADTTSGGAVTGTGAGPAARDVSGNMLRATAKTDLSDSGNKWAFTILAIAFGAFAAGLLVAGSLLAGVGHGTSAGMQPGLDVRFADPSWDGVSIPAHARCSRYGPAGASPALIVTGLPEGTRMVAVAFNDDSYRPLSTDGGHGTIAVAADGGVGWVLVPSIPGETAALPDGVMMLAPHRGRLSPDTAYLGPCSGGTGNHYSAEIMALRIPLPPQGIRPALAGDDVLARSTISLGRY
jgi:hypothetical protein